MVIELTMSRTSIAHATDQQRAPPRMPWTTAESNHRHRQLESPILYYPKCRVVLKFEFACMSKFNCPD
jgi:hypothetical protein